MQRTLVLIKADGVQRQIAGKILARFEDVGLKIVGMKMRWVDEKFASRHYFDVTERHGEKVFKDLLKYLTEGPVISMVLEGIDAEMPGNRCDGHLVDSRALQSFSQAEIDIDLSLDVSFCLVSQQGGRVRVSHRQFEILAGSRCRCAR